MFLFTALFISESDNSQAMISGSHALHIYPSILDIFHFYGRVLVTLIISATVWLMKANGNS